MLTGFRVHDSKPRKDSVCLTAQHLEHQGGALWSMRLPEERATVHNEGIRTDNDCIRVTRRCGLCFAERKMPREYARRKRDAHVFLIAAFFHGERNARRREYLFAPRRDGGENNFAHPGEHCTKEMTLLECSHTPHTYQECGE